MDKKKEVKTSSAKPKRKPIKISSRREKGVRLTREVIEKLHAFATALYYNLDQEDIAPTPAGYKGDDIKLSSAAKKVFPISFECKNHETVRIWKWWSQAVSNAPAGQLPVVVFGRNRSQTMITLSFDSFLQLLSFYYAKGDKSDPPAYVSPLNPQHAPSDDPQT